MRTAVAKDLNGNSNDQWEENDDLIDNGRERIANAIGELPSMNFN